VFAPDCPVYSILYRLQTNTNIRVASIVFSLLFYIVVDTSISLFLCWKQINWTTTMKLLFIHNIYIYIYIYIYMSVWHHHTPVDVLYEWKEASWHRDIKPIKTLVPVDVPSSTAIASRHELTAETMTRKNETLCWRHRLETVSKRDGVSRL